MTDKEAIKQLRKLAKDLINCPCFQSIEEWTEDCCEKWGCKFLINDDCEVQTRHYKLMEETNPLPDFDEWRRAGMPTDPDTAFGL
jgi:hypothetical protein